LNVSATDNLISFGLATETAGFYNINYQDAKGIVTDIQKTVSANWRKIADQYGLSKNAVSRMEPAFLIQA